MTKKLYFIILLLGAILVISGSNSFQCPPNDQITFEKQLAVRPSNRTIPSNAVFTIRSGDATQTSWSALECVRKCLSISTCYSVVVRHGDMECTGLPYIEEASLTPDSDASYFAKLCMRVPVSCQSKLWTTESSVGYRLISDGSDVRIIDNITGDQCSRFLTQPFPDAANGSRSAHFLPLRSYGVEANKIGNNLSVRGKCVLSHENKFTQPESFRAANEDSYYKENQCIEDLPKQIDRCSYEEYYNQTLKHYDVLINGITTTECKVRCERENQFNCRGFTTMPTEINRNQFYVTYHSPNTRTCLLHSEDTLTHGSWLLTKKSGAIYYRRVICLNISVECTPSDMTVTYHPRSEFRGRLYVSGYSDTCAAAGAGKFHPTTLVVPFQGGKCGVNQAYALADGGEGGQNKTLMYTLLVVQNNPIIQAQGDRFVRVGCVAAPAYNLSLGAAINVGNDSVTHTNNGYFDGSYPIPASSIINTTGSVSLPRVKMYIINEPDGQEQTNLVTGGAVALGETIELRIEAEPITSGELDIQAYHLVASSQLGDSSVLLVDGRGCPTGQVDFPSLSRSRLYGGGIRLASRFRAFRFPNSHVVRFNVMVRFCAGRCQMIACDTQRGGQARQSRSANTTLEKPDDPNSPERNLSKLPEESFDASYENASITFLDTFLLGEGKSLRNGNIVVASSETGNRAREICKEISGGADKKIPLELSLIVASNDVFTADSLIYGENDKILVGGIDVPKTNHNMICIHEALFITVTFVWLLVQILILAGCLIVVKRYRSFAEDSQFQKDYHSFDNLGFDAFTTNRRVHWPDQNVDILHAS